MFLLPVLNRLFSFSLSFDKTYKGELDLGIKSNDIKTWHQLFQVYFANEPGDKDTITFTTGMGFPIVRAQEIINVIKDSDTENAKRLILEFYNNFEALLFTDFGMRSR